MAHVGQKGALGEVCSLSSFFGLGQFGGFLLNQIFQMILMPFQLPVQFQETQPCQPGFCNDFGKPAPNFTDLFNMLQGQNRHLGHGLKILLLVKAEFIRLPGKECHVRRLQKELPKSKTSEIPAFDNNGYACIYQAVWAFEKTEFFSTFQLIERLKVTMMAAFLGYGVDAMKISTNRKPAGTQECIAVWIKDSHRQTNQFSPVIG